QSRQRPDERGLAAAVGPGDSHELACTHPAGDAVEGRVWGGRIAHGEALRFEDHASVLRSSRAKSGTPTRAVMTPTGSSSGRTTVRATTSDSTRNDPPTTKTRGRSERCSGRETVRTACGTTSPTNPMMPQVATLAAVSSAVHM